MAVIEVCPDIRGGLYEGLHCKGHFETSYFVLYTEVNCPSLKVKNALAV